MKILHAFFAVVFAVTVMLSLFAAPAAADFVHPDGIFIATYPQDIIIIGGPGTYDRELGATVLPPWYFVPGLMGFDTVKLTITLSAKCYRCEQYGVGNLPTLSGADANGQQIVQWSNVTMTEESNGALLLCTITINVSGETIRGYYMLFVSAVAQGNGATFYGWAQIPVAIMMNPG